MKKKTAVSDCPVSPATTFWSSWHTWATCTKISRLLCPSRRNTSTGTRRPSLKARRRFARGRRRRSSTTVCPRTFPAADNRRVRTKRTRRVTRRSWCFLFRCRTYIRIYIHAQTRSMQIRLSAYASIRFLGNGRSARTWYEYAKGVDRDNARFGQVFYMHLFITFLFRFYFVFKQWRMYTVNGLRSTYTTTHRVIRDGLRRGKWRPQYTLIPIPCAATIP